VSKVTEVIVVKVARRSANSWGMFLRNLSVFIWCISLSQGNYILLCLLVGKCSVLAEESIWSLYLYDGLGRRL